MLKAGSVQGACLRGINAEFLGLCVLQQSLLDYILQGSLQCELHIWMLNE